MFEMGFELSVESTRRCTPPIFIGPFIRGHRPLLLNAANGPREDKYFRMSHFSKRRTINARKQEVVAIEHLLDSSLQPSILLMLRGLTVRLSSLCPPKKGMSVGRWLKICSENRTNRSLWRRYVNDN
jgi:hypothetical protein